MKVMMSDLDGTLFDTKEVNFKAYQEAIHSFGYDLDYEYYCKYCNGRYYLDFLPSITTAEQKILSEIHRRKKSIYSKYLQYARANWSLVDILKNSRNEYKTALVTTASKKNTYDILQEFSMIELFDLIITRDDVSEQKPNPEGYLKAIMHFGARPDQCVIFEDSKIGIVAAEKTGATVYVTKGYN